MFQHIFRPTQLVFFIQYYTVIEMLYTGYASAVAFSSCSTTLNRQEMNGKNRRKLHAERQLYLHQSAKTL